MSSSEGVKAEAPLMLVHIAVGGSAQRGHGWNQTSSRGGFLISVSLSLVTQSGKKGSHFYFESHTKGDNLYFLSLPFVGPAKLPVCWFL